ncbi:putative sporulation protein YyaC [Salinibacillus kushneri]|uniref:Putative sporulation protein YyaC n=1 Tax=Salinibacillus kushneri TaxID=237682 RepID=A0A1I0C6G3_9BACI|nr:spore protease YyaC [Salinibacillus kushneri]SET15084.1 putative sporulation protein YyaC [Salinibacillus kushneri]
MNLKHILFPKKQEKRFYYADNATRFKIAKTLEEWIPEQKNEIVVVCIGTDRSTGDSLGPMVGTLLNDQSKLLNNLYIYGTLEEPVHAKNLEDQLKMIHQRHQNPYIVAIDACLGKQSSIGSIITGYGPMKPGAAVQKHLPEIGDLYISGVVNMSGYMEYFVLQNTRLSIVMNMAKQIAHSLRLLDHLLSKHTKKK